MRCDVPFGAHNQEPLEVPRAQSCLGKRRQRIRMHDSHLGSRVIIKIGDLIRLELRIHHHVPVRVALV